MRSDALPDVRIQFDSTRPIWINCQQKQKTVKVVSTCGRFIKLWRWRLVQTAATRHERIHQISKFYLFTSFFFSEGNETLKAADRHLGFSLSSPHRPGDLNDQVPPGGLRQSLRHSVAGSLQKFGDPHTKREKEFFIGRSLRSSPMTSAHSFHRTPKNWPLSTHIESIKSVT